MNIKVDRRMNREVQKPKKEDKDEWGSDVEEDLDL